ncbi:MAG TPA: tRNA pseudouridine(38-40) synthase TruA [Mariprofundaceae bacterium]|nr:tRNA pseudouridine(38-40) synthase TruA [Mariprofundaceae bacterium]
MTQRIAMALEYHGRGLCGWQRQENGPTVQGHLEEALSHIEGSRVGCVAAGRTDAGVHAEAMLVHADVSAERFVRSPRAYTHGVNGMLPDRIRVTGVRSVDGQFHARFDCRERAYRYQVWNRNTASALHAWQHWWMPRPLSLDAMREAGGRLVGKHDFSSFRASGCQAASPVRELRQLEVERDGFCIAVTVRADAFLYHMVRNLVGMLVEVGTGRMAVDEVAVLLEGRDRRMAPATAPAHGLYFTDAVYDGFCSRDLVGTELP